MTAKRAKKEVALPELPTAEFLAKTPTREEFVSPLAGSPKRLRDLSADELTRIYFNSWIDNDTHMVLARFQMDLKKAGLVFSVKSSIYPSSTVGGGSLIADAAFRRAKIVGDQRQALEDGMGGQNANFVLCVLTADQPCSKDGAALMRKAALILRDIYGVV